jgi:hypothetical protein
LPEQTSKRQVRRGVVARTPGRLAAIGLLDEIEQLLDGRAGTVVISEAAGPEYAAEEASTRP